VEKKGEKKNYGKSVPGLRFPKEGTSKNVEEPKERGGNQTKKEGKLQRLNVQWEGKRVGGFTVWNFPYEKKENHTDQWEGVEDRVPLVLVGKNVKKSVVLKIVPEPFEKGRGRERKLSRGAG